MINQLSVAPNETTTARTDAEERTVPKADVHEVQDEEPEKEEEDTCPHLHPESGVAHEEI